MKKFKKIFRKTIFSNKYKNEKHSPALNYEEWER